MYKAVFFDLDDTLENWAVAKSAIKNKFCGFIEKKYCIDKEKFFKKFVEVEYDIVGRSLDPMNYDRKVWIKETFKRLNIKISKKEVEKLNELYWKIAFSQIKPYPGTIATLKKLKKYKKAIITDSDGDPNNEIKNKKIRQIGVKKYFDFIITSNKTGKNKPDRKMWKLGMKKLKVNPKECIMVGDKPEVDLKPTKEMGFATVWIKRGHWASLRKGKKFKYVDYEIANISELPGIIKKLEKKKL
ncbi:HAD family hydrolase [Candidatus Woesearchaeota archaeon]|nr:HAD family hydrolase [Candidatus Woesearchaeota archaeon]